MARRTRRSRLMLLARLEDPKRMAKPRRAAVAPPRSDETNRRMGREENTLDGKELIMRLLEKAFCQKDSNRESLRAQKRTFEPGREGPVERVEAPKMMEDAVNQLMDKLEA